MKKWASRAYSLCLYESVAMVANIEWILTSFSKWLQLRKYGCESSSYLFESAVVVFLDYLEPALLLIAADLLLARDFLLYPPNLDLAYDFVTLETFVFAID